jgi:hypothetical protein
MPLMLGFPAILQEKGFHLASEFTESEAMGCPNKKAYDACKNGGFATHVEAQV